MIDMYKVNVIGPLMLLKALSDTLIRCRGTVVNIGSVGVYGLPFHGVYASSKVSPGPKFCIRLSATRIHSIDEVGPDGGFFRRRSRS